MTRSPSSESPSFAGFDVNFDNVIRQIQASTRSLQPWIDQALTTVGQVADTIARFPLVHWAKGVPGLSWLLAALGQVNEDKVMQDVAELRRLHPLDTPDQLVQRVIAESAIRGAQVGLVTNVIPPVALALFAVDIGAIAALQAQMIYRIAAIYGFSPADSMRRGEVLALWFVASSSANAIKTGLSFPELIPGLGAAVGIATDAGLLYTVGWLASRFYESKQADVRVVETTV